jgi:CarD family transcriptional regulator
MYKVNDYIVYGATGVCRVENIVKEKDINGDEIDYYVLHSVCENGLTIMAPVSNPNVLIREIISKDEISALIATMPEQETVWITKYNERNNNFKAALKSGKCEEWVKLIKTIYMAKQGKYGEGKNLAKSDKDIMESAEKKLFEEFAIVLNIPPTEVISYIRERVSYKLA